MKFNVFQLSRKGGRKNNEDRMGYCYTRDAALFVLADGMGGHAEGEVAAQLALQTMAAQFQQQAQPTVKKPAEFLSDSLLAAHHRIVRYAGEKGLPDTPRTTVVAALVQNGHAMWVHCGDSRLYVVREGKILLRTRDHSYMEQGEFFAANVDSINRNVLFTCLGSPSRPIFDVSLPMRLRQKDRIMLCSDGLWGNLSDEEIQSYLADVDRPLSTELPEMVEEALRRGGDTCDNTTVLAMGWDMPSTKSTSEVVTDSILEGVFASTIQSAFLTAEETSEMNDDEIERSIAEINEAINRVSGSKKDPA
ncbi:MAG: serine/threonine-protein phosphatase [Brachymonas sp.]|nr:serine/threonine-protein phosphatase [Brachymonas sp.]